MSGNGDGKYCSNIQKGKEGRYLKPQIILIYKLSRFPEGVIKEAVGFPSGAVVKNLPGASLVEQWLRIRLPMQGTRVRALVWEDPTCRGATKPVCHNYLACTLEPTSHNYWAHTPQLLKPTRLEPMLRNKGGHHNEKPAHRNEKQTPAGSNKDPTQPKINK